ASPTAGGGGPVARAGISCAYSVAPANDQIRTAGGTDSVALTTASGCAWTATSNAPWITITPPTSGTGSSTITFVVAANTGAARTGALTVGGQTFTVTQGGARR